jgi:hypothetical protein
MYDSKTLAAMEQSMREEHRKDLEAFERMKRFLPKNGSAPKHTTIIDAESVDTDDDSLDLPNGPLPLPQTIIGRVESIMLADIAKRWTVSTMLQELRRINFPLVAKTPGSTLGLVFAKLHRRGTIRLVRRGSGRTPNVFRGVQSQSQEGDSDVDYKSERPTNGQAALN